ncbi:MAG TPA: hypothetical protein VH597_16725 [Verrucomicrobiae bacterium]|jgi:hypothetical protein|nr:hypothetical protein [Verrucomicrobiae bacterium]
MIPVRLLPICWLLVAGGLVSGCATAGHQDATVAESQNTSWDDMTPAQKFLYYAAWPIQYGLVWGGDVLAAH